MVHQPEKGLQFWLVLCQNPWQIYRVLCRRSTSHPFLFAHPSKQSWPNKKEYWPLSLCLSRINPIKISFHWNIPPEKTIYRGLLLFILVPYSHSYHIRFHLPIGNGNGNSINQGNNSQVRLFHFIYLHSTNLLPDPYTNLKYYKWFCCYF